MFQQSRRRFLAGFAALGIGGSLLGRTAMAQTATQLSCEATLTNKTVAGLQPFSTTGAVYQSLGAGKITPAAEQFGQRSEIRLLGKVGKLAKGISVNPGGQSILKFYYTRAEARGYENFYINIDLETLVLGDNFQAYFGRAKLEIPALTDYKPNPVMNPITAEKSIRPSVSASYSSAWGLIKTKLPKGQDFTAKVTVDGKTIAEIKFPKIALAKIVDALDKEHTEKAGKIAKDPTLQGDLTYATLPAGCTVTKPSSGGSGRICYLTTAAVNVVGLPDDCWELEQLRSFRDRFAASGESAAAAMADYYEHAPHVVDRINAKPDAQRIWLRTYWLSIVPAAIASRMGFDEIGRAHV